MRTSIIWGGDLLNEALRLSGLKTQKSAIEEGLRLLIDVHCQNRIKTFRGKLKWSGDLDRMRTDT